jgi:putative flippase GtrA
MSELIRFFSVTVLGLLLDLAIAIAVHHLLGAPLWLAAGAGFVIAAGANYVIHQTWTFQTGQRRISASRAAKYALVAIITLIARIAAVAALDRMIGAGLPLLILLLGAGVSFGVNFVLSKYFVFSAGVEGAKVS